ncbi:MAG: glycoside hydrolase family 38 C-terminal domain-containing protein [Planctomycetota bacterium]
MKTLTTRWLLLGALVAALLLGAPSYGEEPRYDLSHEKVLYCVGYAHLDTQWRWDYCKTIDQFIVDTLDQNFDQFEKFPGYVFNFTGSVRYQMIKEYYPERYARLKRYIADGRWCVSGSSVDEGDVNVPSPEAIIRQVLYGNAFFRSEFGRESADYMLPDCFGFPASMPSIWAHCGLLGFSSQKLTWGSAVGIPFDIGVWEGPDGKSIIAAFKPGSYVGAIEGRVDTNPEWVERINENGRQYGVYAGFHYYGVGDSGGAPKAEDVANYVASVGNKDGKIQVALAASDQMFKDITAEQRAGLPRYKGDLLLTEHSAGTLTSQAYMKRWNRKNEILADAAERVAVMADWLGGVGYPREKINNAWVRVLASQMHDILPGTSIPRAYTYSWNDEIIAANGFASVLQDSIGAIARAMDTRAKGQPIVVYNPLAIDREDVVEATVLFTGESPKSVRVFDANDKEVPSQVLQHEGTSVTVLFVAKVPSLGLSAYDVQAGDQPFSDGGSLTISERVLENEHYRVAINDTGDVVSIRDKANDNRELLAKPAQLVFTHEKPKHWPAWNMDWDDRKNPPVDAVKDVKHVRIVERGPVRVAVEIERHARDSIFTQRISLARGDAGRRVEFANDVDWQSTECALKASFPLTISNPSATYNLGLGTIERGNNDPKKYEVPSHEWFDLTDKTGEYGVSVLEDCKFGSDKPADNEVRLTLLYTPGVRSGYLDQHSQDWGRHEIVYALYGHRGDWRKARSEWQGRRLNLPLIPFQVDKHEGILGKSFSMLTVSTPQVDVRALKQAEGGDWTIIRLQELWGREANNVAITLSEGLREAYEVDGQERRIGAAQLRDGKLVVNMTPYSPRSFAVRLGKPSVTLDKPTNTPVALEFDTCVSSPDGNRGAGKFDDSGCSMPAEMLPSTITSEGIVFKLGAAGGGKPNAVTCRGQKIDLPGGERNRLYLLAAASEDTVGRFLIDGRPHDVSVQAWTGFIGQNDNREWDREFDDVDYHCEGKVVGIETGFIKRDPIAWFCTHRHHPDKGNEAYRFSYLFKYGLDLPPGAKTLTLPDNPRIKLLAATASVNANDAIRPARALYDDFSNRDPIGLRHVYPEKPVPVFQGVQPVATVTIDRQENLGELSMGAPVATDYADRASGNGAVFHYYSGGGKYTPHQGSGAVDDTLPRLNDGVAAQNDDDTERCVWYDCEGRFFLDLKRSVPIAHINTYSWHRANRAPQYFSLWGSNAEEMPSPGIKHSEHDGWTLLAVAQTRELGEGGIHGSSVRPSPGCESLGPFRHLLWIAEDVGQGTFFTEIDVHVAK